MINSPARSLSEIFPAQVAGERQFSHAGGDPESAARASGLSTVIPPAPAPAPEPWDVEFDDEPVGPNAALAWVLWAVLGSFGAHRFYLRRPWSAVLQLILSLCIVGTIWVLFDAAALPGMIHQRRKDLEDERRRRREDDEFWMSAS